MEGKTEEEVERYAKVFKERYKELNGKWSHFWWNDVDLVAVDEVHLDWTSYLLEWGHMAYVLLGARALGNRTGSK
jgi:hypothetical protein